MSDEKVMGLHAFTVHQTPYIGVDLLSDDGASFRKRETVLHSRNRVVRSSFSDLVVLEEKSKC